MPVVDTNLGDGTFLSNCDRTIGVGELLAMKWSNIDWGSQRYFVREALARKREGYEGGFAEPKTDESRQPVNLTHACLEALRAYKSAQAESKLKGGGNYQDLDLVFSTSTGTPLEYRNTIRVLKSLLEKAGLKEIRFHDLRHTCASLLIAQGENPKYIQKHLRHASIEITFNTYGHLFPEQNREAMNRLDDIILGKVKEQKKA